MHKDNELNILRNELEEKVYLIRRLIEYIDLSEEDVKTIIDKEKSCAQIEKMLDKIFDKFDSKTQKVSKRDREKEFLQIGKDADEREIWANAVLKDGKLMFWWTGSECKMVEDFYKDFLYSNLSMRDEVQSGRYTLVKKTVKDFEDTSFYKQFELHEDFKRRKLY